MTSTFRVSIDRTSMGLGPLVMSGDDDLDTVLSVISYQEPALQARVKYAPSSDWVHGEMALGFTWQQVMLNFEIATLDAASEAASREAIAELMAAIGRLSFKTTITVNDAAPEVWSCQPGSLAPVSDRSFNDMVNHDPSWALSIPAYPVRSYS